MITDRKKAELYSAYIHILRLIDMSRDFVHDDMLEKSIIGKIKKHPQVLRLQDKNTGFNIGMVAADSKMFNVVSVAIKDEVALLQTDKNNKNIGHHLAEVRLTNIVQRGYKREDDYVDELLMEILKNPRASLQKDCDGNNIGMKVAGRSSIKALKKALKNELAATQKNNNGETMLSIAQKSGLLQGERVRN